MNPVNAYFTILGAAGGRVKFLKFHLSISQQSNMALVLPLMLPRCGMSCWMPFTLPYLFCLFGRTKSISLHKTLHILGFIIFSNCLSGLDPPSVFSALAESFGLVSWLLPLIACPLMENKQCESHIRIRE